MLLFYDFYLLDYGSYCSPTIRPIYLGEPARSAAKEQEGRRGKRGKGGKKKHTTACWWPHDIAALLRWSPPICDGDHLNPQKMGAISGRVAPRHWMAMGELGEWVSRVSRVIRVSRVSEEGEDGEP